MRHIRRPCSNGKGERTDKPACGEKVEGTDGRIVTTAAAAATATLHRFPFDEQACLFRFSSWTYDSNKLNLTLRPNAVNREGYMLNGVSLLYISTFVAMLLHDPWTKIPVCHDCFPFHQFRNGTFGGSTARGIPSYTRGPHTWNSTSRFTSGEGRSTTSPTSSCHVS